MNNQRNNNSNRRDNRPVDGGRGRQGGQNRGFGQRDFGRGARNNPPGQVRMTPVRQAAPFVQFCKEKEAEPIKKPETALRFVSSVVEHPDKSETVDILRTTEGEKAVKDAINCLDYTQPSHMKALIDLFKYLTSSELSVGLKRSSATHICTVIFDCFGFVEELNRHVARLSADDIRYVALFAVRVISSENEDIPTAESRKDKRHVKALMNFLSSSEDQVVQSLLSNNMMVQASDEIAHMYESQHDNDFPLNYKDVQLFPTVEELAATNETASNYRGWLGDPSAIHAEVIDKQFRLLREDFVAPMKMEIGEILRGSHQSRHRYWYPCVEGVRVSERNTRGPYLEMSFYFPVLLQNKFKTMQREKQVYNFLKEEEGSRLLERDSVLIFFDENERVIATGIIVERDCEAMAASIFKICGPKTGPPNNAANAATEQVAATIGVWFRESEMAQYLTHCGARRPMAKNFLVAKSSFFGYEPILARLKTMNQIPFEQELLAKQPQAQTLDRPMELAANVEQLLQNDPAQLSAARQSLRQRVTLIQGPPGTGKTFVGVQIIRALRAANPAIKIMVLCYTNHALDSFLESLIDRGIQTKAIARLGNPNRISAKMRDCCIERNEFSRFGANEMRQHRMFQDLEKNAALGITEIGAELQVVLDRKSWEFARAYLPRISDRFADLLKQFEVPFRPNGMQFVGLNGRTLNPASGWVLWCDGANEPTWVVVPEGVPNLWQCSKQERMAFLADWSFQLQQEPKDRFVRAVKSYHQSARDHNDLRESAMLPSLESRFILGATTTHAAKNRGLMDSYRADVLIVEEAAEILEAHVLTNLGPSLKQLIMIGDHKQLRPKLEHFPLRVDSGKGINFDESLFERMVNAGYPHFTLEVQHRMRPEISRYIKSTYPHLRDNESVQGRENILGTSKNVAFIDHQCPESGQDRDAISEMNSKTNTFEVEMVLKMLRYFLQQGYTEKDIVVLTPYLGQLREIRNALKRASFKAKLNDLDENDLIKDEENSDESGAAADNATAAFRIATVDNFQGEEAKIIIASLVRSNERGEIGFVSGPERVNVLFSRARDGFFILGNAETFQNAKSAAGRALWQNIVQQLKADGCFFSGFPAKCAAHGLVQILKTPQEFDEKCPNGGCQQACDAELPLCPRKHRCAKKCHPHASHEKVACTTVIAEQCLRGIHEVKRVCSAPAKPCAQLREELCQAAGHVCRFPCHVEKMPTCGTCEAIKKKKDEKFATEQKKIQDHLAETQRLEMELAEHEAMLKYEMVKAEEESKQRALRESIEATKQKTAILTSRPREREEKEAAQNKKSTDKKSKNKPEKAATKSSETLEKTDSKASDADESKLIAALPATKPQAQETTDTETVSVTIEKTTKNPRVDAPPFVPSVSLIPPEAVPVPVPLPIPVPASVPVPDEKKAESKPAERVPPKPDSPSKKKVLTARPAKPSVVSQPCAKEAKAKVSDEDFTNKLLRLFEEDQWVDVLNLAAERYPQLSVEALADPIESLSKWSSLDHALLYLLAASQLGAELALCVRCMQKVHDELFNSKKSYGLTTQLLYWFVAASVYFKNESYRPKAADLAREYLEKVQFNDSAVLFPNGWLRAAETMRKSVSAQAEREKKDQTAPLVPAASMSVEDKWKMIVKQKKTSPSAAMDMLLSMSSLDSIKSKFFELFNVLELAAEQGRDLASSNFNCLFCGNPGTGKTTVAQLLAQFLIELGLLPKDCEILKRTGSELINGGVSDLETELKDMRDSHGGGVVFVDEAYQLDNAQGHRVLDFILGHAEKMKGEFGKLVWIFAGYTKNMEKLLEHNVGLPSRFPSRFTFEDYDDKELLSILQGLMKRCGNDVVSQQSTVKFKSPAKSQSSPAPAPIAVPSARANPYNPYANRPDETDQWGNLWRWDTANYTFVDSFGNITGIGAANLGTAQNPLVSRTTNTSWLFDQSRKDWYQQRNPALRSPRYPGKPFEDKTVPTTPPKSFYATNDKWMRIAITRLGRLRGVTGFGNARAVRNLFDSCCKRQADRVMNLKLSGYAPDVRQFTREDLLGPKATKDALSRCEAFQKLQALEGLQAVKRAVDQVLTLVVNNADREEREEKIFDVVLNRIFLGNPGTGKTTVAKLYAEILKHLGLLSKGDVIYKTASDFIGSVLGKSEEITRNVLEQARGCVLVIDEAYGLYQDAFNGNEPYREAVINTLVEQISGAPGEDRAVLLLGYKEEMETMLSKANPGLSRRFQMENAFKFEDYDDEALLSILMQAVKDDGLSISKEAAAFALKSLAKARARPHFGNAGAVKNLLSDAKLRMQGRITPGLPASSLQKSDFVPPDYKDEVVSEEELFGELVGNDAVKDKLRKYRKLVEYYQRTGKDVKSALSFNYIFTGAPGTGKTTVARLMGKMFASLKLIPDEEVIEKSASDFVTGYVNQAGKRTREVFTEALGRVLFIDEAYQLNPEKGGAFMSEVVDEIVKLLTSEEFQGKLVVILAGYEHDVNDMLRVNQGLQSRFTERVHFEDFDEATIEDLLSKRLADKHVTDEAADHLPLIASSLKALPNFANGRDVQTYLKKLEVALAEQFTESEEGDAVTVGVLDEALREITALKVPRGSAVTAAPRATPILATQSQTRRPPPPPSFAITMTSANAAEEEEEEEEEEEPPAGRKGITDERAQFLQQLQGVLDQMGFNTAGGVETLSTLARDDKLRVQIANSIAKATGMDVDKVQNLLEKWGGDQAKVRHKMCKQKEEEERARQEAREALVPIWRCGVCGRADQPFIACYVAPYIVRYERRPLS